MRAVTCTLLAATCLAAGCGSGGSTSTTTPARQGDYGRAAGSILRPVGSKLAKLRVEMTRAGTSEQARIEAGRVRRLAAGARAALAKLTPPAAIARQHRALLAELTTLTAEASSLERLASTKPLPRFLQQAAAFENGVVFSRLGATIAAIQAAHVDLGLGKTRA